MLDKAELDFGIYRIMNQKRTDITQFPKRDLIPQVQTILAQNGSGDRTANRGVSETEPVSCTRLDFLHINVWCIHVHQTPRLRRYNVVTPCLI